MKFKYLVALIVVLFISCGMSFAAESVELAGHSFDVPKDFSVNKTNDNATSLVFNNNTNYTIFISAGEVPDFETAKNSRAVAGFNFLADDNYTSENNVSVHQQNYIKNESYYSYYSFNLNGTSFLISYTFPVDDSLNGEDNPVNEIIESFN